jgi:hypothetical protein
MAKEYVVAGAKLKCSMGDSSSDLNVLPVHCVKLTDKLKANIGDCIPFTNVPAFGKCKSLINPAVAAATAAANGKLQPMPCTPTCSKWIPSKTDYMIDSQFPLMNTDKTICPLGMGMIEITDSGQGSSGKAAARIKVDKVEIEKPPKPPKGIPTPPTPLGIPIPKLVQVVSPPPEQDTVPVVHAVSSATTAQSVLNGINPKFFNPNSRFGGGFYIGTDGDTVVAELAEHGATATHALRYDVDLSNQQVLDLTDPKTASRWGFKPQQTTTEDCQKIGAVAKKQGYSAIKFQSYRGDGDNYVIYDNFKEILSPQMVVPIDQ